MSEDIKSKIENYGEALVKLEICDCIRSMFCGCKGINYYSNLTTKLLEEIHKELDELLEYGRVKEKIIEEIKTLICRFRIVACECAMIRPQTLNEAESYCDNFCKLEHDIWWKLDKLNNMNHDRLKLREQQNAIQHK